MQYLSYDRYDIAFPTKEISRDYFQPKKLTLLNVRRVTRYLLGTADYGFTYPCEDDPRRFDVDVDSN